MDRMKRAAVLCMSMLMLSALLCGATSTSPAPQNPVTILFTHDTHDHFLPVKAENGGEYGGYTRLATLLEERRNETDGAVFTLDAGDFSMGSLFQTIYASEAPELRALGAMGYDVVTLGNHEFDYRAQGLADMLNAAKASGDPLPQLVQANYTTPKDHDSGYTLAEALKNYPVTDYTVLEREGVRMAVFGLMGVDADKSAPMSGMELEPIAAAARRVVAEIKTKENADLIVCLSHSGTDGKGRGEDYELARTVPGIDVIISGHTHSVTPEPIRVRDTLIVSCGEYTQNLGVLTLDPGADTWSYELIPVDETVPEHAEMTEMTAKFQRLVDETYLADYGLTTQEVLARSPFSFTPISQFAAVQEEDPLGNLIADSYVYAVRKAEGADYVPVDFAVVASGVVRASLAEGDITVSDAFNVSSLGSGGDGTPGYPLISVYVTGRELRDAFEVDVSVAPVMSAAQLYPAGMTWTWNPHRMIFNRVTSCAQVLENGTQVPLEDGRLYRVVTGLYSGQMLGAVREKSFGLLNITPKDANGVPVANYEDQIIHNKNGAEVKEWYALASYLHSMGTVDGRYAAPEGRKTAVPSWNPIDLLKHPNWITLAVLALGLALCLAAALLVRLAVRRSPHRRGGGIYHRYRGKRR